MKLGTVLNDRYQVIRQIGVGGTSEVYLVKHIYLDSEFAVKVIDISGQSQLDCALEAHVLKDLRHPQLPRIIDIFQDEQKFYIVRDYIAGIDLDQYVDQHGPQTLAKTIDYALQLIEVLNYLHTREQPLIYRDLKPGNLIISQDGRLTLIDFGTTRTYKPSRSEDTIYLGTEGYAPPELFGSGQSDQRTDIYSLGATLYYIYCAEHWTDVPHAEKFSKFNGVKGNALRGVIARAMQLAPEKRYQTVLELKDDLFDKGLVSEARSDRLLVSAADDVAKKIIAVMGLTRGAGCSHQAIAIAKYCVNQIGKTIYMQKLPNDSLALLNNFSSGGQIDRLTVPQSFKLCGIDFVCQADIALQNDLLTQRNTNVVIDYATNYHLLNDFLKAQKKIVVLAKSAWTLTEYNKIRQLMKYQDVEFIVNLADRAACDELADWLDVDAKRLHPAPYLADPLHLTEDDELYGKLIGGSKRRRRFKFWGGNK